MGVSQEHYVILGFDVLKTKNPEETKQKIAKMYNLKDPNDLDPLPKPLISLVDCMSGEYEYFGLLLAKSSDNRYSGEYDINYKISRRQYDILIDTFLTLTKHEFIDENLELNVIAHYS